MHFDSSSIKGDVRKNVLSFALVGLISIATFQITDIPLYLLAPVILLSLCMRWAFRGWIT